MRNIFLSFFLLILVLSFTACGKQSANITTINPTESIKNTSSQTIVETSSTKNVIPETTIYPTSEVKKVANTENKHLKQFVICIDPGHQAKANNEKEPIGPGATEMKEKVSSGTQGTIDKKPEYVLNLEISLKLKNALIAKGYKVVMTRETHNVNISNKERSEIANKANADLFVRIHADGAESPNVKGFSVLYPADGNPYTKSIYKQSKEASELISKSLKESTQSVSKGVVARNDLTGFNWSKVPTTLVEVGFMTNDSEELKISNPKYQDKLVEGMVNGIDKYFKK
jgi:N-acetylmuramoyl-L-alanine amidase